MDELSPIERKKLKARAHALNPIVHIGGKGLTEAVIAEIGRALEAHELIKVRAASMERDAREAALAEICSKLKTQPVQHIGKVLVLFRQKPEPSPLPSTEDAHGGFADPIGSVDSLPADLSAAKKRYLRATGYGRKRPR